jgi:MFS family permease
VALLAEVMPERARPHALGWLQACSALGNVSAAFIGLALAPLEAANALGDWKPWRYMFVIGAVPALLTLLIRRRLKEPERWQSMRDEAAAGKQKLGSMSEMFADRRWRRHAILGLLLAIPGVVGLWGIGFFGFDLVRAVFRESLETEARTAEAVAVDRELVRLAVLSPEQQDTLELKGNATPGKRLDLLREKVQPSFLLDPESRAIYKAAVSLAKAGKTVNRETVTQEMNSQGATFPTAEIDGILHSSTSPPASVTGTVEKITQRTLEIESQLTSWSSVYGLLFNVGAFFGVYSFSRFTHFMGRKPAFAVTFILAMSSTALAFGLMRNFGDVFWMVPLMGFFQIALFGGYAIYFPELFPTRLRSTGTSFCYNVGRYAASPGPLLLGILATTVFGHLGDVLSLRYAGLTMCSFFLIGLLALPFAPETRGQPLPE